MKTHSIPVRALLALAALHLFPLAASPAAAEAYLSTQVGAFIPWQGDAGVSTTLQVLGSNTHGKSRFGGEFEYRGFDSKIVGVRNIDVDSFVIRGMWQYHFSPDTAVTPYLGLGLGVVINRVENAKLGFIRKSTGAGLDGVVLLGISVAMPGAEHVSLFGEGRAALAFDAAGRNNRDGVNVEDVGGATLALGMRFRF